MAEGTFATVVNCMDGRTQLPVIEHLKKKYGVDYVDSITEPGPVKILAERTYPTIIDQIKKRVGISVEKHGSRHIAVVGHHDCAGNPVDKETQLQQIEASIKLIREWGFGAEVIGLWIDERWEVTEVGSGLSKYA
jgi:hypothetical protein